MTDSAPFPFADATIAELQERMAAGTLTARALVHAYLDRIAAIDAAGPRLGAVIEINPDAVAIAESRDDERGHGRVRGPLHGIPVLVKDNVATADAMQTTAGSLALVGARPAQDAALVARLRDAGAVVLGKTNLSEWANIRSARSTSGWSARGGQTRNPYALDRNPSGSSSGSAAAVAADLATVTIGTETDGSIVSPASVCGVVGVKPTVGLVSRTGVVPISASQDTAGPMARTVRDAAILLGAMAGRDDRDGATAAIPADLSFHFVDALDPDALRGARLGVLRGPFGLHARLDAVLEAAIVHLRGAGAELVDLGEYPALRKVGRAEIEVLLYELKDGLDAYLAGLGADAAVKSLADVIRFNEANADAEMPYFGQDLLLAAQAKGTLDDPAYRAARAASLHIARVEGLDRMLDGSRLDAIVGLTSGPAWLTDPVNGDARVGGSSTLAAVAGYPSVTVPAGATFGLPVGLSFTGRPWREARLLALAAAFEARAQARSAPRFLPSAAVLR